MVFFVVFVENWSTLMGVFIILTIATVIHFLGYGLMIS
jgi:hypothetical protein